MNSHFIQYLVHFRTPDDAPVVQNIFSFLYSKSISVCETPSDTLLCYFNMFHLAPSPSSLQFTRPRI
jgi:hypothetical protein